MTEIHGHVAPGFEKVRDAFQKNFDEGKEIGAAFSAYHHGAKVVDLWGGVADEESGRPWEQNTIILVFSTTKGATAICANKLAQEGLLDVDAPVVEYWPEFAANGKQDVPVSYLLSHQAGLAWIDGEMTTEEALSWDPVVAALAAQKPSWEPGSQHGYHATTYGWLVGEVIRRITGKSVGTYFHEQVASPLGLDFWIGLPAEYESRVAMLTPMIPGEVSVEKLRNPGEDPVAQMMSAFLGPETMLGRALFAPGGALTDQKIWNSRAMRAAEVPAANGVGDARSLARMYAACIGDVDGVRLLSTEQIKRATTQQTKGPNKILMDMDIQFGLGFMLPSTLMTLGGPAGFGHFGAGGSVGWADPDAEFGFGYVMNRMDLGLAGDLRSFNLINACYDSVN
jgi:CubicO group peptidase (beta-lactamase class C family)